MDAGVRSGIETGLDYAWRTPQPHGAVGYQQRGDMRDRAIAAGNKDRYRQNRDIENLCLAAARGANTSAASATLLGRLAWTMPVVTHLLAAVHTCDGLGVRSGS